ncbi:enoyl-CoA hydratase/isomerase family protein [Pedobacter cryoconitis]|uniref:Enoyl-CoA hydratase/carnithine racemase n=1 Tax=Pedobacter cryoconitis TaxID=188932 RepID=A0A327T544_9SPHI|nr:enoyl-CoA hydratase/isomerase family protein [Pedobacter cryoconitis]RAJ32877.1 enoyl-CoA hydratase/carnithine racemase [Pedobacter cryoconitis]
MAQIGNIEFKGKSYTTLHINVSNSVATVSLDNAPVNALSGKMMKELQLLLKDLSEDFLIKVIVFDSKNADFFIAHVDINILNEKDILDELANEAAEGLNIFQNLGEVLRNQPQITIVKLKGIARGGGAEFVAAADMSFAALEKGKISQCEALMGIIPGGGATQYLSSKMPRRRVLEIILGSDLFDAETAERYGWINRAIKDSEIDKFVSRLAENIASLPEGVMYTMKAVLPPERFRSGFKTKDDGWAKLAFAAKAGGIMSLAMQNGAQTIEGELRIEELLRRLF